MTHNRASGRRSFWFISLAASITWRGGRMHVRSVLAVWQAPGEGRLYRVGVTAASGEQGVAEIAGHAGSWRLRHLWT